MRRIVSIILPVLNEEHHLARLQILFASLSVIERDRLEIIVVDAGSTDGSLDVAERFADNVLHTDRGRAVQMNRGAVASQGDILLFLHADTELPSDFTRLMDGDFRSSGRSWGRFDVSLNNQARVYGVIAFFMNLRSRLTAIATGDQAMFMTRETFEKVGGFPEIDLMEDIAMSRRLRTAGRPHCIRQKVVTSSRRWERLGVVTTIWMMWRLRLAYFFGADPKDLHRIYYGTDPRNRA